MILWVVMVVFSLLRLASAVIEWQGRVRYERARAAAVSAIAQALQTGGTVRDQRADGTILQIVIPSPSSAGTGQPTIGDGA